MRHCPLWIIAHSNSYSIAFLHTTFDQPCSNSSHLLMGIGIRCRDIVVVKVRRVAALCRRQPHVAQRCWCILEHSHRISVDFHSLYFKNTSRRGEFCDGFSTSQHAQTVSVTLVTPLHRSDDEELHNGGDAENRTRINGFAGRCVNHSATSPEAVRTLRHINSTGVPNGLP